MNRARKNIVVVGFTGQEKNSLGLPFIEGNIVRFVDSISEAKKYQGYLLVYKNKDFMSLVEFDKKYRKFLNKFERIWFYHPSYSWKKDKFSRIIKVNDDIFLDISFSLEEEWDNYKKEKNKLFQKTSYQSSKQRRLELLKQYLKNYNEITTKQIEKDLHIGSRTIERYMQELNNISRNIGYDYSKNEWYFIW